MAALDFRISRYLLLLILFHYPLLGQVSWIPKLDQAKDLAREKEQYIILDISADWCPPCQRMAREVYPDPEFIEFSRSQVCMLLDADKDSEGIRLSGRYNVHVYPTILLLDADGEEIDRMVGGRNTRDFIDALQLILNNPLPAKQLNRQAEQQSEDLEIQLDAGERALQRDDFKKAARFLERAVALSSDESLEVRSRALSAHARAAFEAGDHEASLSSLDELNKILPETSNWSSFQSMRARSLIALKRFDESLELLNELARGDQRAEANKLIRDLPKKYRKDTEKLSKMLEQANKLLEKKKVAEALELAQQALETDPESADAYLVLARARIASGQSRNGSEGDTEALALGLEALLRARRLDPSNFMAHRTALDILGPKIAPSLPESEKARKDWAKAEKNFQAGRLKEASEAYIRVIKEEPTFARAYLHLGDCWFRNSQYDKALQLYTEACRRSPRDAAAHRFRADALVKLQQPEKAANALYDSLGADPGYPMVWASLRDLAHANSRPLERHQSIIPYELMFAKEADYEELVGLLPALTREAWREYLDCRLLWQRQKFQELFPGIPYFQSYQEQLACLTRPAQSWAVRRGLDPDLEEADLDFLAQVYLDGQLDSYILLELYVEEYRQQLEAWRQENPQDLETYLNDYVFGAAQAAAEDHYNSSAIRDYNAGVRVYQADPEKAMELYRKALLQEPFMTAALENLSRLLYAQEAYDEADPLLERWIMAAPESADPYDLSSLAAAKRGDFSRAAEFAEKAVALAQDPENKARLERNLEIFRSRMN